MSTRGRTGSKDKILVISGKDKTDSVEVYRYVLHR